MAVVPVCDVADVVARAIIARANTQPEWRVGRRAGYRLLQFSASIYQQRRARATGYQLSDLSAWLRTASQRADRRKLRHPLRHRSSLSQRIRNLRALRAAVLPHFAGRL